MRTLIAISCILLSLCSFSQNIVLPTEGGKIKFERIDTVSGKSKEDLYSIIHAWYLQSFNSPKDVIQFDQKDNGEISGRGLMYIRTTGLAAASWPCYFTVYARIKEGRYLLSFTDFEYEISPGNRKQMEVVYMDYNSGKMKKSLGNMLGELKRNVENLYQSLYSSCRKTAKDF